ncbi:MAG: hypothetical protein LBR22_10630 [Desulfovibrio sp.]|jgi:hypothetical protein|nr:hypothetical protein [Desulfovibrio sp.]
MKAILIALAAIPLLSTLAFAVYGAYTDLVKQTDDIDKEWSECLEHSGMVKTAIESCNTAASNRLENFVFDIMDMIFENTPDKFDLHEKIRENHNTWFNIRKMMSKISYDRGDNEEL